MRRQHRPRHRAGSVSPPRSPFALAALVALAASSPAQALDTVLGRSSPLRADAPSVVASSNPRSLYVLHCAGCHGLDGAGPGNREVPDLRRAGTFLRVPGGREYLIKVPGVMNSGLDDRDVATVANWMLVQIAAGSVASAYPPYSAAEVARVRALPLPDVTAERRRLFDSARGLGIETY